MMGNLGSERFDVLEQKVDALLKRLGGTPAPPATTAKTSTHAVMPDSSTTRPEYQRQPNLDSTRRSIRELEVELKLALEKFDRIEQPFKQGTVSTTAMDEARGKVLLAQAAILAVDDELGDELERLALELRRKQAEVDQAEAQGLVAVTSAAQNARLNARKPGMVGAEETAKAEAESSVAEAHSRVKMVELEEVGLRVRQLQRRRDQIKQISKLADHVNFNSPVTPPPLDANPRR